MLECLQRLGHETETLAVFDNVVAIVEKLKAFTPDVVFNLTESFSRTASHEPNIPALLELMKVRYTGAGPDALMLCKDKSLAKKLLSIIACAWRASWCRRRIGRSSASRGSSSPRSSSPSARSRPTASRRRRSRATEDEVLERVDSCTSASRAT